MALDCVGWAFLFVCTFDCLSVSSVEIGSMFLYLHLYYEDLLMNFIHIWSDGRCRSEFSFTPDPVVQSVVSPIADQGIMSSTYFLGD